MASPWPLRNTISLICTKAGIHTEVEHPTDLLGIDNVLYSSGYRLHHRYTWQSNTSLLQHAKARSLRQPRPYQPAYCHFESMSSVEAGRQSNLERDFYGLSRKVRSQNCRTSSVFNKRSPTHRNTQNLEAAGKDGLHALLAPNSAVKWLDSSSATPFCEGSTIDQ